MKRCDLGLEAHTSAYLCSIWMYRVIGVACCDLFITPTFLHNLYVSGVFSEQK